MSFRDRCFAVAYLSLVILTAPAVRGESGIGSVGYLPWTSPAGQGLFDLDAIGPFAETSLDGPAAPGGSSAGDPWDVELIQGALNEWQSLARDLRILAGISESEEHRQILDDLGAPIGIGATLFTGTLHQNLDARRREVEAQILSELVNEARSAGSSPEGLPLGGAFLAVVSGLDGPSMKHFVGRARQLAHLLRGDGIDPNGTWVAKVLALDVSTAGVPEFGLPPAAETGGWINTHLLIGPRDERGSRIRGARSDINKISLKELTRIPGIGPVRAERIVEFRGNVGPLESLDELSALPGFGSGTMDKLSTWTYVGDAVHETKPWTILYYLNGDDARIELFSFLLLQDLERIGSSESVNILVQLDRVDRRDVIMNGDAGMDFFGAENFTAARRFYVRRDDDPVLDAIQSIPMDQQHALSSTVSSALKEPIGEVASDRPESLQEFIRWGMTHYPAERTVLVFVGHGASLAMSPDLSSAAAGQFSLGMGIDELGQSIRNGSPTGGIDLFFAHACSMGGIEAAWELSDSVRTMVASEDLAFLVPFHHRWLQHLSAEGPSLDQVAANIVTGYGSHIQEHHDTTAQYYGMGLSAIDLERLNTLKPAIQSFIEGLADPSTHEALVREPWLDQESPSPLPLVDLIHLAQKLADRGDPGAAQLAYLVGHPLGGSQIPEGYVVSAEFPMTSPLIAEVHNSRNPTARGLTILLPTGRRPAPALAQTLGSDWLNIRLGRTRFAAETSIMTVLDILGQLPGEDDW